MQMKKVVKGIVAVGSAAMLMGSTVLGATMDLSNYPAPFSEDGEFNGNIVVGANAATADVIGAVDVASALQAANVEETPVSVDGSAGASVSVEDGVNLEGRKELTLGDNLTSVRGTYDSDALPSLLSEGEIIDETGSNSDSEYSERLVLPSGLNIVFDEINVDGEGDVVSEYVEMTGDLSFTIDFDETLDFSSYDEYEELEILGRTFIIDDELDSENDDLVLFGSSQEASVELGEAETFNVGGEDVEIEVIGGSDGGSSGNSAVITVNGNSESVEEGDTIRANGEEIRVKDVMYSNIGDRVFIIVNLMLGSDELVLPTTSNHDLVEVNGEDLDGVKVDFGDNLSAVDEIEFTYDLETVMKEHLDYDNNVYALLPGDSITDPLFNEITLAFDGVKGGFESGDYVNFESDGSDELTIELENYDSEELSMVIDFNDDEWVIDQKNLSEDNVGDFFIYNEEIKENEEYISRLFEVTEIDDSEITIEDITTGKERSYEDSDYFYGETITLSNGNFSLENENISKSTLWTYDGLEIDLSDYVTGSNEWNITLTDDQESRNVTVDNTDDLKVTAKDADLTFHEDLGDDEVSYDLTSQGTYFVYDNEDEEQVEVYYPGEDAREFAAALGNNDVEITVTEGEASEVMTETVNKIGSGMAYLDSEMDVEGRNIISVGGPAANDVSAELLGDYAGPEGFGEGQAFIKLVENGDDVAMVVAGYSAQDTRHASSVLADYEDYDLSGEEVLVSGTSMDEIEVNSVE